MERITGIISAGNLTAYTRAVEGTEQAHASGAVIEYIWNADDLGDFVDGILVDHDQAGRHKGLTDTNGNEWIKEVATASAVNEFTISNAATGTAPKLSATGGDTNIDIKVEPKGTGVIKAKTTVELEVIAAGTDTATGDAKRFLRIPPELDGMNLVAVAACVYTAGTTNTTDVQIRNKTDSVDMLSTKITIDSGETDTSTAATPAVIDTTKDDVATGDVIAIDIDAVSTTAAKGLVVALTFATP